MEPKSLASVHIDNFKNLGKSELKYTFFLFLAIFISLFCLRFNSCKTQETFLNDEELCKMGQAVKEEIAEV